MASRNKKLFDEINNKNKKYLFYNKKFSFNLIANQINEKYKLIKHKKKGVVILDTFDKLNFVTRFYSCNKAGLIIFISNLRSLKDIKKEKIKINYIFQNNKLTKISNSKNNFPKDLAIILKTSGSTNVPKYVYLSNSNISFVASKMNKEMFKENKNYNELIFAPLDHAFALGRLHSLIKSNNSLTLVDDLNFSNFYTSYKNSQCNSISIPAKLFKKIIEIDFKNFWQRMKNLEYAQISTGYFPTILRKKILNLGINLFINYGTTEAMRSSFLNCKKFPNKINTEGKPFQGVKFKIIKNSNEDFGKVLVKGKNLAIGYSDNKLWKSQMINGWFKTGDLGLLDKSGFLVFHGRDIDNINVSGINYDLKIIEDNIKNYFKIPNIKIVNLSSKITNFDPKLYLFINKKLKTKSIYSYLRKNSINITFEDILITNKFILNKTGKIDVNNLMRKINEKKQ